MLGKVSSLLELQSGYLLLYKVKGDENTSFGLEGRASLDPATSVICCLAPRFI